MAPRVSILSPSSIFLLASLCGVPHAGPVPLAKRQLAQSYQPGDFTVYGSGNPFLTLQDDVLFYLQSSDGNFVAYANSVAQWASGTDVTNGCSQSNDCVLTFQTDGNLVLYANGKALWATNTNSKNAAYLSFEYEAPFVFISDTSNKIIWTSGGSSPVSSGGGSGGHGGGGGGGTGDPCSVAPNAQCCDENDDSCGGDPDPDPPCDDDDCDGGGGDCDDCDQP